MDHTMSLVCVCVNIFFIGIFANLKKSNKKKLLFIIWWKGQDFQWWWTSTMSMWRRRRRREKKFLNWPRSQKEWSILLYVQTLTSCSDFKSSSSKWGEPRVNSDDDEGGRYSSSYSIINIFFLDHHIGQASNN